MQRARVAATGFFPAGDESGSQPVGRLAVALAMAMSALTLATSAVAGRPAWEPASAGRQTSATTAATTEEGVLESQFASLGHLVPAPVTSTAPEPAAAPEPAPAAAAAAAPAPAPPLPAPAAGLSISAQQSLINADRATRGLAPLQWSPCLAAVAAANAARMAAAGAISHAGGVQSDLACGLATTQTGENVGYWTGGVNDAQLNTMFVASPEHLANIVGPYRWVGTAWITDGRGWGYIAVEFA